jgi:hypothetical protein
MPGTRGMIAKQEHGRVVEPVCDADVFAFPFVFNRLGAWHLMKMF